MSLKDRLKRMTGEVQGPLPDVSRKETISGLRKKIDEIMARRDAYPHRTLAYQPGRARALHEVVTGEEAANALGTCFFSRTAFHSQQLHGSFPIEAFRRVDMQAVAVLAGLPELCPLRIDDALFLDTETTGLSGGTGTFAFLVGIGWFEAGDFIVCQFFARDYHEEPSMLSLLAENALDKRFLVTFNGRGFDMPLLSSRYILNRLSNPFTSMPHLDLLSPSRRLFGRRLENSRLVTLETGVLGLTRTGDVPGFEIPGRYFDWIKTRDASFLEDVFYHNRLDIVSMASLICRLTDLLTADCDREDLHPSDLFAAACLNLRQGAPQAGMRLLEGLACSNNNPIVTREARITLSLIHKRNGAWQEAVKIWEQMLAHDPLDLFATEELAKYLEHRAYDHIRAAAIVERLLTGRQGLTTDERDSLFYRLARLKRKMGG